MISLGCIFGKLLYNSVMVNRANTKHKLIIIWHILDVIGDGKTLLKLDNHIRLSTNLPNILHYIHQMLQNTSSLCPRIQKPRSPPAAVQQGALYDGKLIIKARPHEAIIPVLNSAFIAVLLLVSIPAVIADAAVFLTLFRHRHRSFARAPAGGGTGVAAALVGIGCGACRMGLAIARRTIFLH